MPRDYAPILAALAHTGCGRSLWFRTAQGERLMADLEADGSILVWRLGEGQVPAGVVGSAKVGPAGLEEDLGAALLPLEAELHEALSAATAPAAAPCAEAA